MGEIQKVEAAHRCVRTCTCECTSGEIERIPICRDASLKQRDRFRSLPVFLVANMITEYLAVP